MAPQQIAFALKGTAGPNAYVTVTGLNKVVVVDAISPALSIREHIDVGEEPNGIWANAVGTPTDLSPNVAWTQGIRQ